MTVAVAGPTSHWYDLLPGYLVIGLEIGCTMSPMQTIATRWRRPITGIPSGRNLLMRRPSVRAKFLGHRTK